MIQAIGGVSCRMVVVQCVIQSLHACYSALRLLPIQGFKPFLQVPLPQATVQASLAPNPKPFETVDIHMSPTQISVAFQSTPSALLAFLETLLPNGVERGDNKSLLDHDH